MCDVPVCDYREFLGQLLANALAFVRQSVYGKIVAVFLDSVVWHGWMGA